MALALAVAGIILTLALDQASMAAIQAVSNVAPESNNKDNPPGLESSHVEEVLSNQQQQQISNNLTDHDHGHHHGHSHHNNGSNKYTELHPMISSSVAHDENSVFGHPVTT